MSYCYKFRVSENNKKSDEDNEERHKNNRKCQRKTKINFKSIRVIDQNLRRVRHKRHEKKLKQNERACVVSWAYIYTHSK